MRMLAPPFQAALGVGMSVALGYALWVAYETHEILLPLPNRARMVDLAHEPGFFWTTVVLFALLLPCCLFGVWSSLSDMIFAWRMSKKRSASPSPK